MAEQLGSVLHATRTHRLLRVVLVVLAVSVPLGIALAYQDPALRKAIVSSGFGLC